MRSPVRATTVALACLVLPLVLAGCGVKKGGDEPEAERPGATIGTIDTWPLTGLPAGDGNAEQRWPALVVKMDNTPGSAPQVGLSQADLVVEELVEGGVTRLAAFYYSEIPDEVGPVRSMRATDIGIVAPVNGRMITSGAAGITIERIEKAGLKYAGEGSPGFYRESGRSAPYNLFVDLKEAAKDARAKSTRPDNYLPWGRADDLPQGERAERMDVVFSGSRTTSWRYGKLGYVVENSYAAEGDEFPADTVLVLRVDVGDAGYRDPAGNPVPETVFEGQGEALLFHGGRLVRGAWSKASLEAPLELRTRSGDLTVPAGRTWIELVPKQGGDVRVGR